MPKHTHGQGGKMLSSTRRKSPPEFNPANQERKPRLPVADIKFHLNPETLSLEEIKVEQAKVKYWCSLEHDDPSELDDIEDYLEVIVGRKIELLQQRKLETAASSSTPVETEKKVEEPAK